jgi:hypothetical protein
MALQMPYPQVSVTYDTDPKQAAVSREEVLKYVAEHHIPIAGMHIAAPAIGTITKDKSGSGYVFTPNKE